MLTLLEIYSSLIIIKYIDKYLYYFLMILCATSWKVTGLIPDDVIGIFHRHNPSGSTMALELTQPLTEMSTRNISWW